MNIDKELSVYYYDTACITGRRKYISVSIWNNNFLCVGFVSNESELRASLSTSDTIGIEATIPILLDEYRFMRGPALRQLSRFHGMPESLQHADPGTLRKELSRHRCRLECMRPIAIFRRLVVPRNQPLTSSSSLIPAKRQLPTSFEDAGPTSTAEQDSVVGDGEDILQMTWICRRFDIGPATTSIRESNETIAIRTFNEHYTYHSHRESLSGAESFLRDPTFLVVRTPLPVVVRVYFFFGVKHLRELVKHHRLKYFKQSLAALRSTITQHVCDDTCTHVFFFFKSLSNPRRNVDSRNISHSTRPDSTLIRLGSSAARPPRASPTEPVVPQPIPCHLPFGEGVDRDITSIAHFAPASDRLKHEIISSFQNRMQLSSFLRRPCATARLVPVHEGSTASLSKFQLSLLRNPQLEPALLTTTYNLSAYHGALLCPDGLDNVNHISPRLPLQFL
ncbi:hypothetical protein CC2G_008482 [Coprinopsis cinerea AmutBmut pab1-1]|nr:hypothetical protein CC2G_008482 [Coprinopsis cinerea AmutBmut pab1-1]